MLLGATGGFLVYNVHPASIFMGDSGSLLLGFSFAAVTLSCEPRDARAIATCCRSSPAPVLVLLIPIFDTTLVTCRDGCRAAARRRAAAITRRTGWSRSACRSAGRSPLLWLLAGRRRRLGVALAFRLPTRAGPCSLRRRLHRRDGDLRRLPGRHPRLRRTTMRVRRAAADADRRRLHVQAARRRGAARLLLWSRSATTRRTGCGSKIPKSSCRTSRCSRVAAVSWSASR